MLTYISEAWVKHNLQEGRRDRMEYSLVFREERNNVS